MGSTEGFSYNLSVDFQLVSYYKPLGDQGRAIEDIGYQLGRAWGIGQKKLNNGVLFIVAPTEHKTRIEVGYGLEPILTDALSSVIIQTQVLPKFRSGDFNGGVVAGADALIQQLSLETSEAEKRAAAAEQQQSQGNDSGGGLVGFLIILFIFIAIARGFQLSTRPAASVSSIPSCMESSTARVRDSLSASACTVASSRA